MIECWEVLSYTARRPPGRGFLLKLHDDAGRTGYGEARGLEGFGSSPAVLEAFITDAGAMEKLINAVIAEKSSPLDAPIEALFATETAIADLAAQTKGVSLAEFLGCERAASVRNSLLVTETREALRMLREGHRNFKVKAGGTDRSCLDLMHRLVEAGGGEVGLRIDANGSWDRDGARDFLGQAPVDAISLIEQPFAAGDLDACLWLRGEFDIPIALDEGADSADAIRAAARVDAAQVVVVKPMYRGLRGAMELLGVAADCGLGACVTHAMDATVGRLAAMQLAAVADALCGDRGWPHGLFAPGLTSLADEPVLWPDRLDLPTGPGLGCSGLRCEALQAISAGP